MLFNNSALSLKKLLFLSLCSSLCLVSVACGGSDDEPSPEPTPDPETPAVTSTFAKGADVSWVTELEDKGEKFYNANGKPTELMQLLRDECGVNAIRLRVWVNPADKYNTIDDVALKAKRAAALGQDVMIDFHFSDSWADPGKQIVPAAWADFNASQMADAVAKHVNEMLSKLKSEGVTPKWVQIGNETTPGMLHPLGLVKDKSVGSFPTFFNAGYDAVKKVFPDASVIMHIDNGYDQNLYTWYFDLMQANNVKYDMIGMSLYPMDYPATGNPVPNLTKVDQCISNIERVNKRYGKPVMLCEIGMHHESPYDCKEAISRIMRAYPDDAVLKGIFYWEPEATPANTGYSLGCFKDGRPTAGLKAFVE